MQQLSGKNPNLAELERCEVPSTVTEFSAADPVFVLAFILESKQRSGHIQYCIV